MIELNLIQVPMCSNSKMQAIGGTDTAAWMERGIEKQKQMRDLLKPVSLSKYQVFILIFNNVLCNADSVLDILHVLLLEIFVVIKQDLFVNEVCWVIGRGGGSQNGCIFFRDNAEFFSAKEWGWPPSWGAWPLKFKCNFSFFFSLVYLCIAVWWDFRSFRIRIPDRVFCRGSVRRLQGEDSRSTGEPGPPSQICACGNRKRASCWAGPRLPLKRSGRASRILWAA